MANQWLISGLSVANQWLISGNRERIFVILIFLLFSLGEVKDMWQRIPKVLFIGKTLGLICYSRLQKFVYIFTDAVLS